MEKAAVARKIELVLSRSVSRVLPDRGELRIELVRKSIHFLIALTPALAALNRPLTQALLMLGVLFYSMMEYLRLAGRAVPLISALTVLSSRSRDRGRFVLGPVTLGLGALLALLLYPSPAAAIAIYALAFGDGFASLIGKLFGRIRPAFLRGKSIEGSLACFCVVFMAAYGVVPSLKIAFLAASSATLVEAMPLEDYDNLALPVTVGLIVSMAGL
jgi:dolichol kinase